MTVADFIRESNRIEGITRAPTDEEVFATEAFLQLRRIQVRDVVSLVAVYQPDAVLRLQRGVDVRVGNHVPPRGGPKIFDDLADILNDASVLQDPHLVHCRYENLHPFTDGNGRSGRAIWLWQMTKLYGGAPLGFLHHFYYQTLERLS